MSREAANSSILRRFLHHVLPSGFQRVRHGGFYSAAAREKYTRLAALLGHAPPPPAEPWEPTCEQCGGAMRVAAICVGRIVILPRRVKLSPTASVTPAAATTLERAP